MCEFISWIEVDRDGERHVFYLTQRELASKRGRKLRKRIGDDINGHGAIREYYELGVSVGRNLECDDFSTPSNFPGEIVQDLKDGAFRGFGVGMELLTQPAWDEYEKIRQPALDEYEKIEQPAWDEYEKIRQAALDEYEKIEQPALDEYEKIEQPAWDEYEKIRQPAWDEYWDEYKKIRQPAFWDLFAKPENRAEQWK